MSNQNNEYYGENQDDYGSQMDSQGGDEDGTNKGGKRRSKNDNAGRDFKCKYCDKTYLSYPALYTHMKQKHSKGPDGELRNPPTSGRGRGRPRKNPYQRLDPRTEDFFKAPEREGGPVDALCCFQEIFSTINSYQQNLDSAQMTKKMQEYPIYKHLVQFSDLVDENGNLQQVAAEETTANVNGGRPNMQNARNEGEEDGADEEDQKDPSQQNEGGSANSEGAYEGGDGENVENQANANAQGGNQQNDPNKKPNAGLQGGMPGGMNQMNGMGGAPVINSNVNPQQASLSTLPPSANPTKWQRNYDNLTDKDRQEMLVDEIFALYLYRMSNRINQTYYKTVLAYVIFFRECLNEYGWGKKIESEGIRLEGNPMLKIDIETKQFCLVNNAEHAPEICNEFVTVYMEYKKNIFDIPKHDQIDLTINLCHWLFECQFTCSKLTMIA